MQGSILRGSDALVSDARAKVSQAKELNRGIQGAIQLHDAMQISTDELKKSIATSSSQLMAVLIELDDRK